VLEHVRQATLVIRLVNRPGLDGEPERHAFFRTRVAADVVGDPVRQLADVSGWIERQLRGERLGKCRRRGQDDKQ